MKIEKKRIRNVDRNLSSVAQGTEIVVVLEDIERFKGILVKAGFTERLEVGELVLPAPAFGPVSRYNALGKNIVHRNRPKETAYRVAEWHWKEWHGSDRVERSKFVDIPYKRYPRTFVAPPSVQLRIATTPNEKRIVMGPIIRYIAEHEDRISDIINLYLEMFGECTILKQDLGQIIEAPVKHLNWRILPPGKWPWEKLQKHVEPIVQRARSGNQQVIRHRLKTVNGFGSDFVAVGRGGFRGYIVFGFTDRNLFVFESLYTGNATYVFDERWEELSKMTKAQILSEELQRDRIIHRSKWDEHIKALFSE